MKVNINEKDVELRFTFNAFVEYENKFNRPLTLDEDGLSLNETIWFYYFVVLCSAKGWQTSGWLTKDEFDEWLNDDPQRLIDLSQFVARNLNLNDILAPKDDKKKSKTSIEV